MTCAGGYLAEAGTGVGEEGEEGDEPGPDDEGLGDRGVTDGVGV